MKTETIPGLLILKKLEKTFRRAKTTFEEFSLACLGLTSAFREFQVSRRKLAMEAYEQGKKDGRRLRKGK